jgi:hypothetical protein
VWSLFNLSSLPGWAVITMYVAAWLALAAVAAVLLPRRRWNIALGVTVAAGLLATTSRWQHIPFRSMAWIAVGVCLNFILSFLISRRRWREYVELQAQYGKNSPQVQPVVWPLVLRFLLITAVLMGGSALFVSGFNWGPS